MRTFDTGATRDTDDNKLDYEGFLSPEVETRFAQYMNKHRVCTDGSLRDSDNWQKGIPIPVYMKSLLRHVWELWTLHRQMMKGVVKREQLEDVLCAIKFNTNGYLYELLKVGRNEQEDDAVQGNNNSSTSELLSAYQNPDSREMVKRGHKQLI